MREIKFRAWATLRKKMFSAYELGQDQEALLPDGRGFANISSLDTSLSQIHSHLLPLQYTGLKDKKTLTDIYEGDIIDMEGNIRGNIYESPEVYKALSTCVVAGMGYEDWENTKQRLVRQGKLVAEQSNLPQILRELG